MNAKQIQAAVEAVLFAAGEPLELSRLAQALEVNEGLMEQILKNLEAQLDERGSGLCLLRLGNRYQLCTRTEFAQSVRQALEIKRNAPLSQAAFEVLAVVVKLWMDHLQYGLENDQKFWDAGIIIPLIYL